MIQINTQLTFQDYLHFNYYHFFTRPIIKVFIGLIILIVGFMLFKVWYKANYGMEYDQAVEPDFTGLFFPGALIFSLILIYFQAKRIFKTAKALHEPITYTFTEDMMSLKSDSLNSETTWDAFTKVVETKRLFLFYKSPTLANLIPKADLKSEQITALRTLIISRPDLKHKLKKN